MERLSVRLNDEHFKFSCAHFLIFPDGSKERLHGHNYQVDVEIEARRALSKGELDVGQVARILKALCDELDEHWLLPGNHPELRIDTLGDAHTTVTYRDCRYLAPTQEVRVLDVNNVSAENLATWIGRHLTKRIHAAMHSIEVTRLRAAVSETSGQWGVFRSLG